MKTGKKQVDEMLQLLGQELSESRFEKMNDTNQKQDERIEITPKPRRFAASYYVFSLVQQL